MLSKSSYLIHRQCQMFKISEESFLHPQRYKQRYYSYNLEFGTSKSNSQSVVPLGTRTIQISSEEQHMLRCKRTNYHSPRRWCLWNYITLLLTYVSELTVKIRKQPVCSTANKRHEVNHVYCYSILQTTLWLIFTDITEKSQIRDWTKLVDCGINQNQSICTMEGICWKM